MSATATPEAPCRVRLADGRMVTAEMPTARQRALHLRMLHQHSAGFVELAAGRRPSGEKLAITTRRRVDHFLPGGATGGPAWLASLLALAARHADAGEEVFVAPAVRSVPAADKRSVHHTRWLWVDVDRPDRLGALWAFTDRHPAHLVIESGGSGGVHAYWRLAHPLAAIQLDEATGDVDEPIELANAALIRALGVDSDGRPDVADAACRDRSRVMRLAGTRNYKTGAHARIVHADLRLSAYDLHGLVGELVPSQPARPRRPPPSPACPDELRRVPAREYFARLAGAEVPPSGLVRCPNPRHRDSHPSCSVGDYVFHCHGCGEGGGIYDLASLIEGGPTGHALRGERFKAAAARVREAFPQ